MALTINIPEGVEFDPSALTASRGQFVVKRIDQGPEVFEIPSFSHATRTYLDASSGQLAGFVAQKGVCHTRFRNTCVEAPMSHMGWAPFHREAVALADGSLVAVGRLTSGGNHAGPGTFAQAIAHHDRLTTWGLVAVREDEHGIAFAGIPADGVADSVLNQNLSEFLSGDWRRWAGNLELIEALTVDDPGFPIQPEGELVASGAGQMDFSFVTGVGVIMGEAHLTAGCNCGEPTLIVNDPPPAIEEPAPADHSSDPDVQSIIGDLQANAPVTRPPVVLGR